MSDEKSISGMVESHQSPRFWNSPYLVLNLTLIVKGWIVLAKAGWHKEVLGVSGGVGKEVPMGQQGLNINWGCRVTAMG